MMMEPDLSNVDAARSWLGSRYPNSNYQTGSPLYQYLKDELAKGHKLKGRETHLSLGGRGGFLKWIAENSGGNAVCYPTMRVTIYPEFVDPPTPETDEDDYPKLEQSKKLVKKSKRGSNPPHSAPNPAQPRRRKPPTTDRERMRIQKERFSTLRPRRNGKVFKNV